MQIKKEYRFYAAHRNQDLKDKCSNIHGHVYRVSFFFNVERSGDNPNISTLFGDFDSKIEPHLKQNYDHGMMIDRNDKLFDVLCNEPASSCMKFKVVDRPTSVENICFELFKEVTEMGFDIQKIELKETDSSTIIYTKDDFKSECTKVNSCYPQHVTDKSYYPQHGPEGMPDLKGPPAIPVFTHPNYEKRNCGLVDEIEELF